MTKRFWCSNEVVSQTYPFRGLLQKCHGNISHFCTAADVKCGVMWPVYFKWKWCIIIGWSRKWNQKEKHKIEKIKKWNADLWENVLFLHPPQGGVSRNKNRPDLQLKLSDRLTETPANFDFRNEKFFESLNSTGSKTELSRLLHISNPTTGD